MRSALKKGVKRLSLVTDQRAHIVREECVEANVSEAELVVAAAELLLPIRAKREERMIASDRVLPGVLQRRGRRRQTGGEARGQTSLVAIPLRATAAHVGRIGSGTDFNLHASVLHFGSTSDDRVVPAG